MVQSGEEAQVRPYCFLLQPERRLWRGGVGLLSHVTAVGHEVMALVVLGEVEVTY